MPLKPEDRAAYQRHYRARKRLAPAFADAIATGDHDRALTLANEGLLIVRAERIAELEAEVKHLKAELAKRTEPSVNEWLLDDLQPGSFNSRPFTPAPKK